MNYSPNDLQNISFNRTLIGGYRKNVVDNAMQDIVEDYQVLIRENIELKDKVSVLNDALKHYKSIEEALQNSLIVAQKTSDELKSNAQGTADNIIKEAKLDARSIIEESKNEVIKTITEYEELKKKLKVFKIQAESFISSQLELVRTLNTENKPFENELKINSEDEQDVNI